MPSISGVTASRVNRCDPPPPSVEHREISHFHSIHQEKERKTPKLLRVHSEETHRHRASQTSEELKEKCLTAAGWLLATGLMDPSVFR